MIDINEVEAEIYRLENEELCYANCAKLADLYVIRDRFKGTVDAPRLYLENQSEFIQSCNGKNAEDILAILDEHFNAIMMLYPKEYAKIIAKIKGL